MGGMLTSVCIRALRLISIRTDDFDLLASEIQDKTPQDVAAYYPVFRKKWKELSGIGLVPTHDGLPDLLLRVPSHRCPHS